MSTCLVLGASGQIGRHLVPALLGDGHEVVALSRVARPSRHPRVRWLQGDVHASPPDLPRLDAIFSLGPLDGLAAWLDAAGIDGAHRLVAFGSQSVLSKRDSDDPDERALAHRLGDAERALAAVARARSLAWTLFRPTLIYGSGLDRSLSPLARFGRRWRVFPLLPAASGLRQPVHAADLARACRDAWTSADSHGATYALGGGERLTFATMLGRVQASLGVRSVGVPLPLAGVHTTARLLRMASLPAPSIAAIHRLRADLVADDDDARGDFGWRPRAFSPTASDWRAAATVEY